VASGKKANDRGKQQENSIAEFLKESYEEVSKKLFFGLRSLDQPIFAKQCKAGKNIYGKERTVDFILFHPVRYRNCLVIQSKWQSSGGSVDEKYPFEVMSIEQEEFPTIIVLDGGGYSKGAERWLKDQVGKNKLIAVLNMGEFARKISSKKI